MRYRVQLIRLGQGYTLEIETTSVTNAYIQARQKLCFKKGFENNDTIENHSCTESAQEREMDWFFDILNKKK